MELKLLFGLFIYSFFFFFLVFAIAGTQLFTGSTYPITASWALYAISGGTKLFTGSTYPITSSWGVTASYALNSGTSTAVLFTSSFCLNSSI